MVGGLQAGIDKAPEPIGGAGNSGTGTLLPVHLGQGLPL